jgi:hypothetical protein
MVMATVTAA